MQNSLFMQLIIGGIAVALLVIYVQPTFVEIGKTQETIQKYKKEYENITKVNNRLASLVSDAESISISDQTAMHTYLPNEVDDIIVSKDLFEISEFSGIHISSIAVKGSSSNSAQELQEDPNAPTKHIFGIDISGSYLDIKYFLSLLEQNNYPLEVHNISIRSIGDDLLAAELEIVTYSHI